MPTDTERLDWLDEAMEWSDFYDRLGPDKYGYVILREAIDKAMREGD
jgi:hypothetical protein